MKQKFDFSINTKTQAKMKHVCLYIYIYIYIHTHKHTYIQNIYTKAFINPENNQKGYTQEVQTQKESKVWDCDNIIQLYHCAYLF